VKANFRTLLSSPWSYLLLAVLYVICILVCELFYRVAELLPVVGIMALLIARFYRFTEFSNNSPLMGFSVRNFINLLSIRKKKYKKKKLKRKKRKKKTLKKT